MLMSLPNWDLRATSNLRAGSLIEYKRYTDSLGVKEARAYAIIIRMDWKPRHTRSRCIVLTETGAISSVDIIYVLRVITY